MFKKIRIGILLLILAIVAGNAWLTGLRTTDWDIPLEMVVYPVNGDGSDVTADYISSLDRDVFQPIANFLGWEGEDYQLTVAEPLTVELSAEVDSLPPPAPFGGSRLQVMLWSLKMRWWAWRVDNYDGPGNIKVFVVYYDPANHKELGHSLGLKEGLLCMVKAFASRNLAPRNNVIIAHELLHTLGATDKYDPATGMPLFPAGYGDPEQQPLYPQTRGEIMGGLIPRSETEGQMPSGLRYARIGPDTAAEIGWSADEK